MAAYIVADVQVTDPQQYEEYRRWSSAAMQAHGAEVLVRGGQTVHLEGREPARVVILKFNDIAHAQAFYDSEEYRRAREARAKAAIMNMFIVQGI